MERSSKEQEDLRAQDELWGLLDGGRPLHVTLVAAACLRAVDAAALNAMLAEPEQCRRFRQIRQGAQQILQAAGGAKNIVYADTLAALGAIVPRHERADDAVSAYRSLGARALAQALHDTREHEFWSYFSDWNEARKLAPGDPVPVPTLVKLHEIYRLPLRLSPCPDTRDTPHGLCPGGYGGLPSLRLMPACPDGDVYLDPSLDRELCPIATGDTASAAAAVVVPAEHLDQRYDYDSFTVQDERVFSRVRPRGAADGVNKLIDDVIADLRRAGDHAALVVLPELTSTPELEDAIGELLVRGELGKTQLVVAGSSWIPAGDAESAPGDNRSTSFPRGSDRHHHYKFSWFHHKAVGAEYLARRRKRITILAGPKLTFTTLICKDALETWPPKVLQELRVRLVVVPSCNAGVAAYQPFAMGISDLGWGTVVLANIPPEAGAQTEYALVVRPAARVRDGEPGRVSQVPVPVGYNSLIFLDIAS